MNIGQHKTHPAADLFPLLGGNELAELVADVREHGLQQPIVLSRDGSVLDGRNRYLACLDAGVPPRFETFAGASEVGFVISANLRRRHLEPSQRAMLMTKLLPELEAEAKRRKETSQFGKSAKSSVSQRIDSPARNDGKAVSRAAKLGKVNRQYIADAKKIAAADPALAAQVEAGEKSIPAAKRELKAKKLNGHAKATGKTKEAGAPKARPRPSNLGCDGFELTVHACGERVHSREMLAKFDALIAPLGAVDLEHLRTALHAFAERIDAHVHPDA